MAKRAVRYAVVDAFTDTPFKGNPAAVCLLEEEEELAGTDDQWMQAVAKEFNVSATAFITPSIGGVLDSLNRRFHLRYFIRTAEIELCGHATLASAHFLFESGVVKGEMIEFYTKSGILTIKKMQDLNNLGFSNLCTDGGEKFSYELDFPVIEVVDCTLSEIPSIPITLNGLSVVNASKTKAGDLIVELTSGKDIVDIRPNFDEIERCAGRSVVMTAPAPPGTGFELYTRVFCPKMGHNEDPVTGSLHCALAGYWSKKLGKQKLIAYQASTRGGILQLQLDEQNSRVRIRGDAVTVMAGTLKLIYAMGVTRHIFSMMVFRLQALSPLPAAIGFDFPSLIVLIECLYRQKLEAPLSVLFASSSGPVISLMARRSVRYAVVDAFTDTPFKGNPAAVCLLEEEAGVDDNWMQNVAKEFNISETAFLVPSAASIVGSGVLAFSNPRFRLRWFTPVAEVKLCGHATLASAHFLFTSGLVKGEIIEFDTLSGILTTKKVQEFGKLDSAEPCADRTRESFSIELDFPIIQVEDCVSEEIPSLPETLNDLSMVNVQKTCSGDLLVELSSGKDLANVEPNFVELKRCVGRGVIMTAPAPPGTGFDFFTRFFCPKMEINEDPVCGSAHCALAPYWSRKLGKHNLIAYQASQRGGILDLQVDEERSRVLLRGKAVTVMEGFLMA